MKYAGKSPPPSLTYPRSEYFRGGRFAPVVVTFFVPGIVAPETLLDAVLGLYGNTPYTWHWCYRTVHLGSGGFPFYIPFTGIYFILGD